MPIGKSFHLTLLVDDLAAADRFFLGLFAPHCFYRGYAPLPLNRTASLFVIGDFVIEPMQPHPPADDERGTTIRRLLDRFGPCVQNIAFYATDLPAIAARMEACSIRSTDGGQGDRTLFAHPKDFPGLVELMDPTPAPGRPGGLADPRLRPQFDPGFWRRSHGLGIALASHVTVVVHDLDRAVRLWSEVMEGRVLPHDDDLMPGARSAYLRVGSDTVIELVEPIDSTCPVSDVLESMGEAVCGVTFLVDDLDRARRHVERFGGPIFGIQGPGRFELDRKASFGALIAFTDRRITGDDRQLPDAR
ncbi:MAG: VOC family protein [Actinomycetota bacterium]|nr:VOC family protein [Actinomycetota bacterium]